MSDGKGSGEPFDEGGLGRISRADGRDSTPDWRRFGEGAVKMCSRDSGADFRLLEILGSDMIW